MRSVYNLGVVAEYQGDTAAAEQRYRECLTYDLEPPYAYAVGVVLRGLSATTLARGAGHSQAGQKRGRTHRPCVRRIVHAAPAHGVCVHRPHTEKVHRT